MKLPNSKNHQRKYSRIQLLISNVYYKVSLHVSLIEFNTKAIKTYCNSAEHSFKLKRLSSMGAK
ncbi:hypothetical protein E4413_17655 [Leptospira interrogans]|nr:hypothetical protein E4412_17570 [Leptospira interrogans]QCO42513.1 hypothetical protein E4413_17655 [Leptospira interrogans]